MIRFIGALTLAGTLAAGLAVAQDKLCDLSVHYIQRTPRYPGYLPNYGLPERGGQPTLTKPGADNNPIPLTMEEVDPQQRWPKPGETVTYTAVVANQGTADAPAFEYAWYLDGRRVAEGKTDAGLKVGERTELVYEWPWAQERHELVLWVDPMRRVRQISYANDRRPVWTHAKLLVCGVDRVTYESFAANRNFLGTQSFEDWCQEHADWMNHLWVESVYPETAPDGVLERVSVDFIGAFDDERAYQAHLDRKPPLANGWDGGWWFGRNADCSRWAAGMDWGLIHEWGHQFGLTDLYALDVAPENNLVLDAHGTPLLIGRLSVYAGTMMHGHGPVAFSEDQAIALNHQLWRRRGYYGDYYYALARENAVRITDSAGQPVRGARLRIWQRQDGLLEGEPKFVGETSTTGEFTLPNEKTPHVVTHGDAGGGYELRDNPFGLINVVGANGVLLLEITARGQTEYAFLEIPQFNVARARQGDQRAVVDVPTTLPVDGAAAAPASPEVRLAAGQATLTLPGARQWTVLRADPTTYQWKVVGEADGETYVDTLPRSGLFRYAAATRSGGKLSARSAPVGVASLVQPWGIAVGPDGLVYVRDRHNGQTLMMRPDGSAVGFVGSVHWHFEGSYDHATDAAGQLYIAKWPDGYDPKRSWIRRINPQGKGREHDRRDLAGGEFDSTEPGRFREPMGISIAPDGRIIVADTGNNRVQILSADGQVAAVIDGLQQPHYALLAGTRLVVCDTGAGSVAIFEPSGDTWREVAAIDGFTKPVYLSPSHTDDVWVADQEAGRVYAIDVAHAARRPWTFPADGAAPITDLRGIAYDATNGDLLYVAGQDRTIGRRHVLD